MFERLVAEHTHTHTHTHLMTLMYVIMGHEMGDQCCDKRVVIDGVRRARVWSRSNVDGANDAASG